MRSLDHKEMDQVSGGFFFCLIPKLLTCFKPVCPPPAPPVCQPDPVCAPAPAPACPPAPAPAPVCAPKQHHRRRC
jgi:hypothetical protein